MKTQTAILLALVSLFGMSCASASKAPPNNGSYQGGQYAPSAQPTSNAPAARGGFFKGKSASPAVMDSAEARESYPTERPGLGTSFGETRTSHVKEQSFNRASYNPFATISMYYNDEEGVAAQVAYQGGPDPYPYYAYTPAGGISIALQDEWGRVLDGTQANGKTYIVGQDGSRYTLVIQNLTAGRFEIVASVDGLDVIDGLPASLSKRGYLLEPYATLTIDGFRTSASTVAAFRFGSVSESYAGKTSGDRNVGVIGVAFFSELGSAWTTDELQLRDTANPFPGGRTYAQPPKY